MPEKLKRTLNYTYQHDRVIFHKHFSSTLDKGEVKGRVMEYLEALDYKRNIHTMDLTYERSSKIKGVFSTSPRSLYTTVEIDFNSALDLNVDVEAKLTAWLVGGLPLKRDYEFWQLEIDGLESAVTYGYINPLHSLYASDRSKWFSCWLMSFVVLVAITGCILLFAVSIASNCTRC